MLRWLRSATLALTLASLSIASAGDGSERGPQNVLNCSISAPPYLSCSYQRSVFSVRALAPQLELYYGVFGDVKPGPDPVRLAPYFGGGWFEETYAFYFEFQIPESRIPVIGTGNRLFTLGMEYRW
jgi:hypothetical protein